MKKRVLTVKSIIKMVVVLISIGGFTMNSKALTSDQKACSISMEETMPSVYKILNEQDWLIFSTQKFFAGSKDDLRDGFIHLASASQVDRVIKKYFSLEKQVYVLKYSHPKFIARLKWEPSSSGEIYPHLYNSPLLLEEMECYLIKEQE